MATTATKTDPTQTPKYLQELLANAPTIPDYSTQVQQTKGNLQAGMTSAKNDIKQVQNATRGLGGFFGNQGPDYAEAQSVISSFQNQVNASQAQAKNWATGLESQATAATENLESLQGLRAGAIAAAGESVAAWQAPPALADQYVLDIRADLTRITSQVQETMDQYVADPTNLLADRIQEASYTWRQTNKQYERNVAERYGTNSAEFREYQDSKNASIGAMVSQIRAQTAADLMKAGELAVSALSTVGTAGLTAVNWAQQKSLDIHAAAAGALDAIRLNTLQYVLQLDQAQYGVMSEMSQWFAESPVLALDSTGMMSQIMEIRERRNQQQKADDLAAMGIYMM